MRRDRLITRASIIRAIVDRRRDLSLDKAAISTGFCRNNDFGPLCLASYPRMRVARKIAQPAICVLFYSLDYKQDYPQIPG